MNENEDKNTSTGSSTKESFHDRLLKDLVARGRIPADIMDEDPEVRRRRVRIVPPPRGKGDVYRDTRRDHLAGPPVNCLERLHICHAACCKLGFALSREEVERGMVAWDPERPYFIRHDSDGHCHHLDRGSLCCGVYQDRPRPCQNYSCQGDPRIWTDFEGMVLNTDWIEAALEGTSEEMGSAN